MYIIAWKMDIAGLSTIQLRHPIVAAKGGNEIKNKLLDRGDCKKVIEDRSPGDRIMTLTENHD